MIESTREKIKDTLSILVAMETIIAKLRLGEIDRESYIKGSGILEV